MATISHLSVSLSANTKGLEKGLTKARRRVREFSKSIFNIKTAIAGALGVGGVGVLVSGLIDTNQEMQKLKSSLKTVTGSAEAAGSAFSQIEKFATTTPYDLNQVVDSFIKLKALGLDPSERALNSYGNTAAAMGKSLNQFIEAVADASTSEFERLKEFGIKAKKQGDQVTFTFQGVATTIKNNSEAIQGYLLAIGENQFGGAMADQMNNLTPAFSNFRAAIQGLQVAIGEAGLNRFITDITNNTTNWINSLDKSKIEEFTRAGLNTFADMLEGLDNTLSAIRQLPGLGEMGLIGYMLFGKKGLALAAGASFLAGKLGDDIGKAWQEFNPSQITPGVGGFGGSAGSNTLPGYQVGDFNAAGRVNGGFERVLELREKYGQQQVEKQTEGNEILKSMVELLRNPSPATAG